MPSSSWLARLLARARRPQAQPRMPRSRWNPIPLRVEPLEDRLAPAFNLTLNGVTANVSRVVNAGTATYEATGTGATLSWGDIGTDLAGGLNVVVTSGSGGAEAGNIFDTTGSAVANAAGTSLTFQSGTGAGLVGSVTLNAIRLSGANSSILVSGAGNVTVGTLDGTAGGPLAAVSLASTGGAINGGTVVATDLNLTASFDIGAAANPFLTNATNLAARTTTAGSGIRILETDAVNLTTVAGVVGLTTNDGPITLNTTDGSLTISQPVTAGTGPVTLRQGGTFSLLTVGAAVSGGTATLRGDDMAITAAITAATVTLSNAGSGRRIDLGTNTANELGLTDAELDLAVTGNLVIGAFNTSTIRVSAPLTQPAKNLTLTTAAGVTGSGDIINGSATATTVTFDQEANSTYSGSVGGPAGGTANDKNISLVKVDNGILTLTGTNTYTGTTAINGGTLLVTGTSGTGAATVNGGATLGGTGTVGGGLTVANGGTLSPGTGGVGTLSVVGGVTFNTGSTFSVQVGPGAATDRVNVGGNLTVNGGTNLLGTTTPAVGGNYTLLAVTGTATVNGTGFRDANGTNLTPPSGGPIVVGGQEYTYSYIGGLTLTAGSTSVALDGSGNLIINDLIPKNDSLAIFRIGAMLRVFDPNNTLAAGSGVTQVNANTVELPFANILGNIQVNTLGGNDLLTVDYAGGVPVPVGGLVFAGGAGGNDKLSVKGSGTETATYTPSATTNGNGTISVDGRLISFNGLEPVDLSGMMLATVSPPNGDDVITVANGVDFATGAIDALVVTGTSGGVGFEAVALYNNATVLIDATAADGADTVSITSANNANGITNLTIVTGTNGDSLTVSGPVNLPGDISLLSTTVTVNGSVTSSAGGDIVLVAGDSGAAGDKLTLNNDVNAVGGSGTISLMSDEDIEQNFDVLVGGAADVAAVALGSITMAATSTTFSNGGNVIYSAGDSVALASIETTGDVAVTAGTGAISDANGAAVNVTAGLALFAAGPGGVGAAEPIDTDIDAVAAEADGDIAIINAGALEVANGSVAVLTPLGGLAVALDGVSGANISLVADSLLLTRGVVAMGNALLTATVAGIADNNGDDLNVTAIGAAFVAVTGVGVGDAIETDVSNLEAGTDTGGVFVTDTGDLVLGGAFDALDGVAVTGATGDIDIFATGSISVVLLGEIVAGPAAITLTAGVDIITGGDNGFFNPPFGAVGSSGGLVILDAAQDVIIGVADPLMPAFGDVTGTGVSLLAGRDVIVTADSIVTARDGGVLGVIAGRDVRLQPPAGNFGPALSSLGGGTINVLATGDFSANSGVTVTAIATEDADIIITAANIELGDAVFAGTGTVLLTATTGAITDPTGGDNRVGAAALIASAITGISLDTNVGTITAAVTGTGVIAIDELNEVDLTSVTTADGDIAVLSGDAMLATNVVAGTAGSVFLTATAGDLTLVTVTAAADATLEATTGNILDDGDNMTLVTAGVLTLTADRAIGQPGATAQIDTDADSLLAITNGAGPFMGAPTPGIWVGDVGSLLLETVSTGDGFIVIDAAANLEAMDVSAGGDGRNVRLRALGGDLTLGLVQAADDIVFLTATGQILDANADLNNVTAGGLILSAGAGIGDGDGLETAVSELTFASGTGGIELANAGALSITSLTAFGITSTGGIGDGAATVSTASPLTVAADFIMGGAITLTAGETDDFPACADDLTVSDGITVESTTSTVTLQAGDDILIGVGATVRGAAGVLIEAGFNDLDLCGGFVNNGTIESGGDLAICVLDDLLVGTLSAPGFTVSLRSINGAILDGNDALVNVTASAVALRAAIGIGTSLDAIETDVDNFEAETDIGGLFVLDTGNLVIGGVTPDACVGPLTGAMVLTDGNLQIDATGDLTLNVGGDTVAGPGDIFLTAQGVLTISQDVTSTAAADGASMFLTGFGGVTINNVAFLSNSNGNAVTIDVAGIGSAGHLTGVTISQATLSANGGAVVVNGTGFDGTDSAFGVHVTFGAVVQASGAGTVSITGTGGNGVTNNVGVNVTGFGSIVRTIDGNLTLTGTGQGTGASNGGIVVIDDAAVQALGTGGVSVTGIAGNGTAFSAGVVIFGANTQVSTNDGPLSIAGTGGTGTQSPGIAVVVGATVSAGLGTVTLSGTSLDTALGVVFSDAATVTGLFVDINSTGVTEQTGGLIRADGLRLQGTGTFSLLSANEVGTLAANTDGEISLANAFALFVGSVLGTDGITTSDDDVTLCAMTGELTVEADINVGTATVRLQADEETSAVVETTGSVIAGALGIRAGSGGISFQSMGNAVGTLAATTTGNFTFFTDTSFAIGTVTAKDCFTPDVVGITSGGDLAICVNDDLFVGVLTATGTVSLRSVNGAILDGTGAGVLNVTANALALRAATGIGIGDDIDAQVNFLEAMTDTGGIFIDNVGDLVIGGVTPDDCVGPLNGVTVTTSGDIDLEVDFGSLTVNQAGDDISGPAEVFLDAEGSITVAATNLVSGVDLIALADTDMTLRTQVTTISAETFFAGAIDITELDGVTLTSVISADGPITVTAGDSVVVTSVVSTTDSDANDISITATAGDITVTTITAGALGDVTLTATAGSVLDDSMNATVITADVATLTALRAIGQPGATAQIDTTATSLIAATTGTGFDVGLTPGIWVGDTDDLTITSATTQDGFVVIDAGANLVATLVTAGGASRNVRLRALGGDLTAGVVTAADDIVLLSATGAILDGNAIGADVTAGQLALVANGVGTPGDSLNTAVSTVAWNSGTGGIFLDNTGALTIGTVTAFGVTTTGGSGVGDAVVTAASPLTVANNVVMGGNVTLTAGEISDAPDFLDRLALNIGVVVQSTGGDVTLRAGDNVFLNGTSLVNAAGSAFLEAGFNDLDGFGGIVLSGDVIAGANVAARALDDITFFGSITATNGTVSLRSVNGGVADGDAGTDITALALAIKTATGIGVGDVLETQVGNFEAETDTGGIFVLNTGDLVLGGVMPDPFVGPLTGVKVLTTGDIVLDSDQDLTANVPGDTVAGPDDIELTAQAVLTISQDVTSTAAAAGASIFLTGFGGVTIDNGATVSNENSVAVVLSIGGQGSAAHAAGVTIDGATVNAGPGSVLIEGMGANVTPFADGVQVFGGAVVRATGAGTVAITGTSGDMAGSFGISFDDANTSVLVQDGDLDIFGIGTGSTLNNGVVVGDGALLAAIGSGDIVLRGQSPDADVSAGIVVLAGTISAGSGDITLIADEMDFTAGASITGASDLFLRTFTQARGISLGAAMNQAGKLSLTATDLLALSSTFDLITVGRGDGSGAITVDGDATFGTDVIVQTPDNTSPGISATATLSVGNNRLDLISGSTITTSGAGLYQAGSVLLDAETGIGTAAMPVQTQASAIEATTSTGGVFLHNTGDLTIGGADPFFLGLFVMTSGDIVVNTVGSLTVAENVSTPTGDITLSTTDLDTPGQNITILAGNDVMTDGGDIALRSGDNLTIAGGASLQTSGTGTILLEVDANSADALGGTATFQGSSLTATAGATALGNGDADTFNLSPSAGTPITVNGAAPTTSPGDTMNLDLTGFTGQTLQITETFTATTTITGAMPVSIVSIEDVNVTEGSFNVLLDLSQASQNGTPFGTNTAAPDAVSFGVNDAGTDLVFAAGQDGAAPVAYFQLGVGGGRSASFIGSADETNFSFVQSATGLLPTFNGGAIGAHNVAPALPQGTFTVANVGVNWQGGSTGADTLAYTLTTAQTVSYFADLFMGVDGGNVEVANAFRASFGNLARLSLDGNNGTLLVDSTLAPATEFTIGDIVSDGMSEINGNGSFTDALFGGFNVATVRGGDGTQLMTLNALDAMDAALQQLTISGDNAFGNDQAADVFLVNELSQSLILLLDGGAGDDVFNTVPGQVTVLGDAGANRLAVLSPANSPTQNVTITNVAINGGGTFNVQYQAVGGTFNNGVYLQTGDAADNVTINSTAAPTAVATMGGNDTITIAGTLALRNLLRATVNLDAGDGVNTLNVSDLSNTVGGTYDADDSFVSGPGWRVEFGAAGSTFGLLTLDAGTGNDLVRVQGIGANAVVVNARPGNDTIRVFVGNNNLPTGLTVNGGLGMNSLQTISNTGPATIRNFPTGPNRGLIQVSYVANQPSVYQYLNIQSVLGINATSNYIVALYRHILGRNPNQAEVNAQLNVLNTQGRLAVVRSLEASPAGRTFLVQEWFVMFFGRLPTPAESAPLVQRLLAGQTEEAVLGVMLNNPTLPQTAAFRAQLVTAYYQDLLRRNPTTAELNAAVGSTQPLQTLRELLEVSQEFFLIGI